MAGRSSSWSAQQLAEFLAAVSAPQDSGIATRLAVERAAESLEAEVAALVRGGAVATSTGFPAGRAPDAELIAAAGSSDCIVDLPGLGACSLASVGVADAERLLVARQGSDGFAREEIQLLRGMARVLRLTLDSLGLLERERRAQQRLAASERQSRQIIETAHDAFVAIDSDGLITDWSAQAEATFGWPREAALGLELADTIIPEAHREAHRRGLERFLATGDGPVLGRRLELSALHRDGREFPVELTISPLQTDEGYTFNAFLRDITERREMERVKDEFISVVSHELRTPLTSIRGSLGLLEGGVFGRLPEKGQRMVEIAVENTDRLVRLINDILDIERLDSGKIEMQPVPCDAQTLVARATESLESIAAEAAVTLVVDTTPAPLSADPDRVIQTLTNLISNAVKFSPAGSTIRTSCAPQDGIVLFQVGDQGRGIPPQNLETIFERFQQVDASDSRVKGGSGLGLAICRSIVDQHGGKIWADSVPGQGSTFSFELPTSAGGDLPAGGPVEGEGPTVLVCDDDASVVEVVGAALKEHGYRAISTYSGEQALERAISEPPDAILLDLLMPGMSGWETAAALKEHSVTSAVPIVILSVLSQAEARTPGGSVVDWIEKPLDEAALFQTLERAIRRRDSPFTALIVEADRDVADLLCGMFKRGGVEAFHAATGPQAIELGKQAMPDLLVLNLGMAEADGLEVVDWLRSHERLHALPLVVYTDREPGMIDRERLRLGSTTEFLMKGYITLEDFEQRVTGLLERLTRVA